MMDFRRTAHIKATMSTGDVERAVRRISEMEERLYQSRHDKLRRLQRSSKLSAKKRADVNERLLRLRLENEKKYVRGSQVALKEIENNERRFEAKHRSRMRRAEQENERRHRSRRQLELHTQRLREREEKKAEAAIRASIRRVDQADARMNSNRRRRAATGRRHAGGGVGRLGGFGGLGKDGGFGMIYGSGGVGLALAGGFMAEAALRSSASAALERSRAMSQMMSLVTDQEREMGYTFEYALGQAKALGQEIGITVPEAARALREAITGDVSPFKADEWVRMARMLSVIEGVELEKTVTSLTAIRNAFGLSGDQMLSVPDVLFAGVDEGNLKLGKLSSQIGNASAMAAQAGMDFRELSAAASALTKAGMSSDTAFTSLRAFATGVLKPPTRRVAANREMAMKAVPGLGFDSDAIQSEGLIDWLDKLNLALDRTGMKITDLIGGRERALRGVALLLGNMNQSFKDIYAQQAENPGIGMQRGMEVLQDNMGKWERTKVAFITGWEDMGDAVLRVFGDFVGEGNDFELFLMRITSEFRGLAVHISSIAQVMEGLYNAPKSLEDLYAFATGKTGPLLSEAGNRRTEELRLKERQHDLKMAAARRAAAAGGDLKNMQFNPMWQKYVPINRAGAGDPQSLGTTEADRQAARERKALTEAVRGLKEWNDTLTSHGKHVESIEAEKTKAISAALQSQRAMVKQHYAALASAAKESASFHLSMQDKVAQRRGEFAGVSQLEKFILLQQRIADAQKKAALASKAGDFATAKQYNTRAINAADELRTFDVRSLSETSYADRQSAIEGMAGVNRSTGHLEAYRRRKAARERVTNALRGLDRYVSEFDRSGRNPENVGKQYSLSAMEAQIQAGGTIRDVERTSLETDAEKAHTVYTDLADRLASVREIWRDITKELKEAAEAFSVAAQGNFQHDPKGLSGRLQQTFQSVELGGRALEALATPRDASGDEVAKSITKVYHQERIHAEIQVNGAGDPQEVAEEVARRLRVSDDRKSTSLTSTE